MDICRLYAVGFRNFCDESVEFSPGVNIITGDNAQGKTNLLEAVYFLCSGRSFRTPRERECISFGGSEAVLNGTIEAGGRDHVCDIIISSSARRKITVNGIKLSNMSELSGRFPVVLFSPEDLSLVREGAAERRRFLDLALCRLRPKYASSLSEYGRLHEHKKRILRDWHKNPSMLDTLDVFNRKMAESGAYITGYRRKYIKKLAEWADKINIKISNERLDVRYITQTDENCGTAAEIADSIYVHMSERRSAELESGMCLCGPHKDDLEICINGKLAKSFGSQGQTRTSALALKLAEWEISGENFGEYPILLLDDVMSELDRARQGFILNYARSGQVLITCCVPLSGVNGHIISVVKGTLR